MCRRNLLSVQHGKNAQYSIQADTICHTIKFIYHMTFSALSFNEGKKDKKSNKDGIPNRTQIEQVYYLLGRSSNSRTHQKSDDQTDKKLNPLVSIIFLLNCLDKILQTAHNLIFQILTYNTIHKRLPLKYAKALKHTIRHFLHTATKRFRIHFLVI